MFTKTDNDTVWQHTARARMEIYTLVSSLDTPEWDHVTLCDGWRVRDVIGHMILLFRYSGLDWVTGVLRARMDPNKFIKDTAISMGDNDTEVLLSQFASIINARQIPLVVPPINALIDALIHEQDIRIAMGKPRDMPVDSLKLIFKHWRSGRYNIGERITGVPKRTDGLQFVAEDIGMQYGSGLPVIGKAQDVLLAMAGRTAVHDRLRGEGITRL